MMMKHKYEYIDESTCLDWRAHTPYIAEGAARAQRPRGGACVVSDAERDMAELPWERGTLGVEHQLSGASLLPVLPCTCCSTQSLST